MVKLKTDKDDGVDWRVKKKRLTRVVSYSTLLTFKVIDLASPAIQKDEC
jgi:hypothetical protein